jgi:hypothetical protein
MTEALAIAGALLQLYIAVGVMLIGCGYLAAGTIGAGRVAAFYFGRSVRWVARRLRLGVTSLVSHVMPSTIGRLLRCLICRSDSRWLSGRQRRLTILAVLALVSAFAFAALAAVVGPATQRLTHTSEELTLNGMERFCASPLAALLHPGAAAPRRVPLL